MGGIIARQPEKGTERSVCPAGVYGLCQSTPKQDTQSYIPPALRRFVNADLCVMAEP